MNWFLIVFGIAVVISPLMWLRQSPQAKRMTELRGMATQLSIQVSLHRRPDAREDEVSLDSVCYGTLVNAGYCSDLARGAGTPIARDGVGPSTRRIQTGMTCWRN
jgi:hypothetical protein